MLVSRIARPALIGAVVLISCLALAPVAWAGWQLYGIHYFDEGDEQGDSGATRIEYYLDEDDPNWIKAKFYFTDGTTAEHVDYYGNPSPEDRGKTGLIDMDNLRKRLERLSQLKGWREQVDFWQTPIGKQLTKAGKGPSVTDPPDDGSPKGTAGSSPKGPPAPKDLPKELTLEPGELGSGKGAFDPMAGSLQQQVQQKKGHGRGKKDPDYSDKDPPPDVVDPALTVGPPALVNPSPEPIRKAAAPKGGQKTTPTRTKIVRTKVVVKGGPVKSDRRLGAAHRQREKLHLDSRRLLPGLGLRGPSRVGPSIRLR